MQVLNAIVKKIRRQCFPFVMENLEKRYLSLKREIESHVELLQIFNGFYYRFPGDRTHQCKSKNTLDYEDLLQLQQFF